MVAKTKHGMGMCFCGCVLLQCLLMGPVLEAQESSVDPNVALNPVLREGVSAQALEPIVAALDSGKIKGIAALAEVIGLVRKTVGWDVSLCIDHYGHGNSDGHPGYVERFSVYLDGHLHHGNGDAEQPGYRYGAGCPAPGAAWRGRCGKHQDG